MGFNQLEGARRECARQASELIQRRTGVIATANSVETDEYTPVPDKRGLSLVPPVVDHDLTPQPENTQIRAAI